MSLELRHVTKTFGGQTALRDVHLCVDYGEVHALVGQNGSGKSTLIKLLSGYHQPDPGAEAHLGSQRFELGSAAAAQAAGLRFVHQDLALVLGMSVLDNMMLGRRYPTGPLGRIRRRAAADEVRRGLDRLGVRVDVHAPTGTLSMAERSAVAIARAVADTGGRPMLVVLDEPTAALPSDDVGRLLSLIERLRNDGHGVLLVSHHLNEVLDVANRITVLRDGKVVASLPRSEIHYRALTELIVGHSIVAAGPERTRGVAASEGTPSVLRATALRGGRVDGIDLAVAPGEIVGVAGITGSGRESLGPLLTCHLAHSGEIVVGDRRLRPGDPRKAMAAGMAAIPGERLRYGIFPNFDVRTNMTISLLDRHLNLGRISRRKELGEVRGWIEGLGIVTAGPSAPILSLSGGNQQKVLVGRALRMEPKVLVLDDPTQGIDIGARDQIHQVIEDCARRGIAIVLISTDSDELARLSDRVLVLSRGKVAEVLDHGPDLTARAIDIAQLEVTEDHETVDASG